MGGPTARRQPEPRRLDRDDAGWVDSFIVTPARHLSNKIPPAPHWFQHCERRELNPHPLRDRILSRHGSNAGHSSGVAGGDARGRRWTGEKLVLTELEGRYRHACFCCARWNDVASKRSLSPPCEGGAGGGCGSLGN